jgi:hypothetical protein
MPTQTLAIILTLTLTLPYSELKRQPYPPHRRAALFCCANWSSTHSGSHAAMFHASSTSTADALPPLLITSATRIGEPIKQLRSMRFMPAWKLTHRRHHLLHMRCYKSSWETKDGQTEIQTLTKTRRLGLLPALRCARAAELLPHSALVHSLSTDSVAPMAPRLLMAPIHIAKPTPPQYHPPLSKPLHSSARSNAADDATETFWRTYMLHAAWRRGVLQGRRKRTICCGNHLSMRTPALNGVAQQQPCIGPRTARQYRLTCLHRNPLQAPESPVALHPGIQRRRPGGGSRGTAPGALGLRQTARVFFLRLFFLVDRNQEMRCI